MTKRATRADLQSRVEAMRDKLQPTFRDCLSLDEIQTMAIQRVREELEAHLEEDLKYGNCWRLARYCNGPLQAAAVLTLFNSIYR